MKRKPVVIKIQENEMKALARGFLESIVVTRSVTPLWGTRARNEYLPEAREPGENVIKLFESILQYEMS